MNGGKQMINKHEVGKMNYLKSQQAESLETVHTHTHTLCLPNK